MTRKRKTLKSRLTEKTMGKAPKSENRNASMSKEW